MDTVAGFSSIVSGQVGGRGARLVVALLVVATVVFMAALALAGHVTAAAEPVVMAPFRW